LRRVMRSGVLDAEASAAPQKIELLNTGSLKPQY